MNEAYSMGNMPNLSDKDYQETYGKLLDKSHKIAQVRKNIELYKYNGIYLLVKDNTIVIGHISLSPITIFDKSYLSVENIYIYPVYRKTSAASWLLYAVKEQVDVPVVADGAIFTGGQELIQSILKHKMFNVSVIDTSTGVVHPLTNPINSADHAYLFTNAKLGFGKQMFEEELPFTWYPIFEEIE